MKKSTKLLLALLLSAMPWAAGCGGVTDENLSGKAEADPAKLRTAQAEAEAAAAKARADEAAKTKGVINVEER